MTFCTNCGAPLPADSPYCSACGQLRAAMPPPSGQIPAPPPGSIPPPPSVNVPPYPGSAPPYRSSAPPYPGSVPPYLGSVPPYPGGVAPPPKRARSGLIAAIAGAAVIIVAAGAGVFVYLSRSEPGPGGQEGPTWLAYLTQARVGYACTFEATAEFGPITATSTSTQRVTGVETTAEGTRIDLSVTTTTETSGDVGVEVPDQTFTQDLTYIVGHDGTMSAPAPPGFSAGAVEGFEVDVSGAIVFPSIEDLRDGAERQSSMEISMAPTDPAMIAELGQLVAPGDTALELRLEAVLEGVDPETITTPAGEYTDVVGVAMEITDIEFLNPSPALGSELGLVQQMLGTMVPTTVTWFARGVGVVRTDVEAGLTGTSASELTGCTG